MPERLRIIPHFRAPGEQRYEGLPPKPGKTPAMKDSSRNQGLAICAGAVGVGLLFGIGLLSGAYWAVAIPVALLLAFVLGLTFCFRYTLSTVSVEPEGDTSAARPPAAQASPTPGEGRRDPGGDTTS
jgi:hypothetical protein